MSTVPLFRHPAEDSEKWKLVFDEHRCRSWVVLAPVAIGCSSTQNEPGTQLILNEFPGAPTR
jgi:hypothetical protein